MGSCLSAREANSIPTLGHVQVTEFTFVTDDKLTFDNRLRVPQESTIENQSHVTVIHARMTGSYFHRLYHAG
jgi:hypothetical protein